MSDRREEGELRIQQAIEAYRSDLKDDYGSVEKAAAAHGVKRSTLGNRICGKTQRSWTEEAQKRQKLSVTEEDILEEYLLQLCDINFPVTIYLAKRMADGIYQQKHNLSDFSKEEIANIKLGKRWIDRFMKRHTELYGRFASRVDRVRVDSVNQATLEDYFAKVKYHI
ncbi:hypothetical protein EV426DRAFT_577566 [Tirmania nivea]|nr:hypothetical protein EV426DRAFT_577566 [Tirmania nivea]